jgi:hypothetical protein
MLFVFLFMFTFCKHKQQNINKCQVGKFTTKPHQYGYQMKALELVVKNMPSVYQFLRLFTFYHYEQTNVYKTHFLNFSQLSETQIFLNFGYVLI